MKSDKAAKASAAAAGNKTVTLVSAAKHQGRYRPILCDQKMGLKKKHTYLGAQCEQVVRAVGTTGLVLIFYLTKKKTEHF